MSITGEVVLALVTAEMAGIEVEPDALTDSLLFVDELTDSGSGRVGYQMRGGLGAEPWDSGHENGRLKETGSLETVPWR